ncbi:flagellar basal body rod protein FlgB [Crassaminicella thermophila]|uniref:Flagellar basal body rod protein FlgB n=1 Tax=Crassaminicella thermophila TaxID=2599308 RepID=A0A5C0SCP2_CRATE|nr:flagellar basal body rod protein FlgB [Crassaminicella thermophila]QEK12283.1 flagellar basal body rod protein FlgB [Crassaminicella thermophila]
MNILDKSFKHINILEKSMNASWLRNEVISNNIANVNTPKFKRSIVKFESILAERISNDRIEVKLTHKKHLPLEIDIDDIEPTVIKDRKSKYRKDGNNVNIDVEMANLSKNTIRFNMLSQIVSQNLRKLKLVVKDGR